MTNCQSHLKSHLILTPFLLFPQKSKTITNKDELWFNESLKNLRQKKLREYNKHRKSEKYLFLDRLYNTQLEKAKFQFQHNFLKTEKCLSGGMELFLKQEIQMVVDLREAQLEPWC